MNAGILLGSSTIQGGRTWQPFLFREALQKTGVNIKPILLRLKDRENAENDRSFDRISINFPLFEMEFLRNWFGNPAQGR